MTNVHRIAPDIDGPTADAKWNFATHCTHRADARRLDCDLAATQPGDLILAEVTRIGNHKRLQLADRRYSPFWIGDRIIVACADLFAVDQFDGRAPLSVDGADLLAGAGVVGKSSLRMKRSLVEHVWPYWDASQMLSANR